MSCSCLMRAAIVTFGCRVNHAESLAIESDLRARAIEIAPAAEADVVFVNSCSVTATADQGTRQTIRRIARENPNARIIVTGCYATRQPEDLRDLPNVEAIVPNHHKDGIVDTLKTQHAGTFGTQNPGTPGTQNPGTPGTQNPGTPGTQNAGTPGTQNPGTLEEPVLFLRPGMSGRTAFTLRVQTGCDEPCTYCIIPSTRGHARSTPVDEIVTEVRRIEAAGYKEVTLTGVHLGAYGRDLASRIDLGGLLRSVIAGTEEIVFRLGSLEPMDCTAGIIDLAASCERLAPAFHLPLQHASDRVLAMMARPYTRVTYDAVVTALRDRIPDAAITADVIVGFPGEEDHDVDALLAYLERSPLTSLHVFPYSDRPGTPASRMPDKVPGPAVRARARAVRDVGERLAHAFKLRQIGSIRRALTIEHGAAVVTDNGLRLRLKTAGPPNEHVYVRVGEEDAEIVYSSAGA